MQTFQLESDEVIILKKRKYWFEYVLPVTGGIFNALLPLIALVMLNLEETLSIQIKDTFSGEGWYLAGALYMAWVLFIWINVAIVATNIYLDVLVITNKRIVDIEQKSLFARTVSTVRFDRIQDITVEVHGLIPTMLHFGTLRIQTAGEEREFVIKNIHNPYAVKDFIIREQHRIAERKFANSTAAGIGGV